jgi:hypothetical protein
VSVDRPTLLTIQHVPWEGPHRILDSRDGLEVVGVATLAGGPLPDHSDVDGVVTMGAPAKPRTATRRACRCRR